MIEHRPDPGTANGERRRRDEPRPRTGNQPRRGEGRGDAGDADQAAEKVADEIAIERQRLFEQRGHDIEQPAIEVEILEFEQRAI